MSCLKKDAMYVFLKKLGFIANYFFKTTNKLLLFTTVILCEVSVFAEQSVSVFGTSQLCACCAENNSKTIPCHFLDLKPVCVAATGAMGKKMVLQLHSFLLGSFCGRHWPSAPLNHKVLSNFTYMFQWNINKEKACHRSLFYPTMKDVQT